MRSDTASSFSSNLDSSLAYLPTEQIMGGWGGVVTKLGGGGWGGEW